MIRIHKSIFYDICEKNIDLYNDFMKDLLQRNTTWNSSKKWH